MLKKIILLSLTFSSHLFAKPLPDPYKNIEVLPFDSQSWYKNESQIEYLIRKNNIDTVIEVGCWLGASTRHIASCLPSWGKVYAVDSWSGSRIRQEMDLPKDSSIVYQQFLSNVIHAGLTGKIIPIIMDGSRAAKTLAVTPGLVYIDSSRDSESIYNDLRAWYPFVQGRGILCGDDWKWEGTQLAVQRFAKENQLKIFASQDFWHLVEQK